MSNPEKLTIQCILNILSAEDKTTLENKVWDERVGKIWLGLKHRNYDDNETPTKLVVAENEEEAILKLFKAGFFHYEFSRSTFNISNMNIELPDYTEDISIEEDFDILCKLFYHKHGCKLSYKTLLWCSTEIKKVSKMEVVT